LNTYEKNRDRVSAATIQSCQAEVLHHMGLMSHYVGDTAQPLHTTKHHHGWVGDNPQSYSTAEDFHAHIDGVFIDYGGAGIAFKMGGLVKHSTEMYSYVASFGVAMNEDFWNKLPPDLKKLVVDSMTGREKEVGEAWDALDVPGKKALIDGGAEAVKFSAADTAKVRQVGDQVSEAKIKELEGKGLPARAVYTQMRSLADKHAKTSKNFWN
jgi:hypothetical protein